ncbi:indole-3-glycerol phosphate synthase, chloroplastic [Cryptomeria japonica]|uniref:indole-3-glycerol phosphate synthase, chloroplastic n=1 Tax=Cryptomeria japonica TaxID=3369 RepID=UPI0027DA3066|nr:indole-3-glycerol phosphate synthase, chloroplastic [Cryptomeria japonica]
MGSLAWGVSFSALISPQKDRCRPFSINHHHLLRYRRFMWNTSATNRHSTFVCSAQQVVGIRRYPPHSGDEGSSAPSNILEEIVWNKGSEVAQMKENMHLESVKEALPHALPPRDFIGALKVRAAETGLPALIAEVKKASPSRGIIQPNFDPVKIAQAYAKGGAACLSVLTDSKYFQGSFENLQAIRHTGIQCPLLCKEFIVDEYQLYYARLKGADAVLLIASVLPDQDITLMLSICKSLGMAALVEVHSTEELDRILGIKGVKLIGINNRDLETFTVDIRNTEKLLQGVRGGIICDRDIIVVGESGLFTPEDVAFVQRAGVGAVLVGESIVKQNDPAAGIAGLFGKDISRKPE